jgi:transcription initiation factor TFIID subunit 2
MPSASRPTIKLKVGAQTKAVETTPKAVPKPRARKPKAVDALPIDEPPPYVDDGSHDILQEVLAIEREKDEEKLQRRRSTSEKEREKLTLNGVPGKRKKTDILTEEDDILALATPAKKEKPTPTGSSSAVANERIVVRTPTPKTVPPSHKIKKDKTSEPNVSRPSTADIPRISIKGKEKEVVSPTTPPTPSKSRKLPVVQATPINAKKCKDLLKVLLKLPEAAIFTRPVDPQLDGCPT